MAKLLAGRFNRFVEKLFATKEGRSSLDTISPELQITYTMLTGVEDRYLQGWNRYAQDFSQPAVAGQFSIAELRNPAGSGVIIVLESLLVRNNSATVSNYQFSIRAQTTDQATVSTGQVIRLDPRGGPTPSSILSIGSSATAPNINAANMVTICLPNGGSSQFIQTTNQELTVLPGDAILVFNNTVNLAGQISMLWRERVLEPSELS